VTARLRAVTALAALALVPLFAVCDGALSFFLGGAQTTIVRLVNNGDFPVVARVAISDEDDIPEALLEEDDDLEFTIEAGGSRAFTRDCNDLRAVMVTHAELRVLGGVGPEADSGVLREGDDFSCGDAVTFRFDHSDVVVDFDVTTSVE